LEFVILDIKLHGRASISDLALRGVGSTSRRLKGPGFSGQNKIKLRSGATSLFDVQRWTFDVGCSVCSMFNVGRSMLDVQSVRCWTFIF